MQSTEPIRSPVSTSPILILSAIVTGLVIIPIVLPHYNPQNALQKPVLSKITRVDAVNAEYLFAER